MTPPKPYKIVRGGNGYPDWYDVTERATGEVVGCLYRANLPWGVQWEAYDSHNDMEDGIAATPSRTEAAVLVYQAWLDRTSEGMKK